MKNKRLRIIFMGTPEFAVPSLDMLIRNGYDICCAVTQPDKPKGRGNKMLPPPVKAHAEQHGIPVLQFSRISREGVETLLSLEADLMVTVAYGQILSDAVLAICPFGCINVHASLLPRYRGAAPIERAIMAGERTTGVSTMFTVREVDAGDVLEQDVLDILPEDTGGTLRAKLAEVGAETLRRTIEKLSFGTLKCTPQRAELATYAPIFKRDFGRVRFNDTCEHIVNLIRAINPEPGAYTLLGETKLKLWLAVKANLPTGAPGEVMLADQNSGLVVSAADGSVEILRLQYPGGREMSARDFLRGHGRLIVPGMHLL